MKTILLSLSTILFCTSTYAQTFTFNYVEARLDDSEVVETDVRKHFMGEEVGRKMILLNESYVFYEEVSTKNPLPTRVVDKYAIYSSVKKLNPYYKKAVKKNVYTHEEALNRFTKVLNVALCIRYQDTKEFEEFLLQNKDADQLDQIFNGKIILNGLYNEVLTRVD